MTDDRPTWSGSPAGPAEPRRLLQPARAAAGRAAGAPRRSPPLPRVGRRADHHRALGAGRVPRRRSCPALAKMNLAGSKFTGYGCPGHGELFHGLLMVELARIDPSLAIFFGGHDGLGMGTIALCGSEEQKQRWLPPMARMEKIGAFALTEPDVGSDAARGLRHHRPPRRRHLGAQRRQEVDRQRHLVRPRRRLGPRRGRRAGQGLRRRARHPRLHHREDARQDRVADRAERR